MKFSCYTVAMAAASLLSVIQVDGLQLHAHIDNDRDQVLAQTGYFKTNDVPVLSGLYQDRPNGPVEDLTALLHP